MKIQLEIESSNEPRWLKCSFHQSGSGVVTVAVSAPMSMKVMSSDDIRCVVIRDADRYEMCAESPRLMARRTAAQKGTMVSPMNPWPSTK